jgi:hypothetical protein
MEYILLPFEPLLLPKSFVISFGIDDASLQGFLKKICFLQKAVLLKVWFFVFLKNQINFNITFTMKYAT